MTESVRRRYPRWEIVGAGVLCALASAFFSSATLTSYWQQRRAASTFVAVPASVEWARVTTRAGARSAAGGTFGVDIGYRYSVDGRDFHSNRYFYTGPGWRDRASADAVVARYQPGAAVEAHVDPGDPAMAVLDRSTPPIGAVLATLGSLAASVGVILLGLRGPFRST